MLALLATSTTEDNNTMDTCPRITPVVRLLGSNTSFHVGYLPGAHEEGSTAVVVSSEARHVLIPGCVI